MQLNGSVGSRLTDVFRGHIERGIRAIMDRLACSIELDEEEAERSLELLNLALADDEQQLWAHIREFLLFLAPLLERAGYRLDWMTLLQKGIERSRQFDTGSVTSILCFDLAVLYQLVARWDEAESWYRQANDALVGDQRTVTEPELYLRIQSRLAYIARLHGDLSGAEQILAAATSAIADNVQLDDTLVWEYVYFVYGTIAYDREALDKAEEHFRRSLRICQEHKAERQIARRLRDVGSILSSQEKLEEARTLLEQAIVLFDRLNDPVERAVTEMNLGIVEFRNKEPLQALDLYELALPVFRQTHDQLHLGILYNNQGVAYRAIGLLDRAEEASLASLEIRRRLGNAIAIAQTLRNLARVYGTSGEAEKAVAELEYALAEMDDAAEDLTHLPLYCELQEELEEIRRPRIGSDDGNDQD